LAAQPSLEVGPKVRGDLRLTGQSVQAHLSRGVAAAAAGLLAGPLLAGVSFAAGLSVPLTVPAWLSLVMAAVGFVSPTLRLRQQAAERRRGFRHACSAFLDVVALALAGGQGVESALWAAAAAGEGWAFSELRGALERAVLVGETPWSALDRLGADLDVGELRELAAAVGLAGEHGAKVAASVIARAESLRARGLAEVEADAHAASERMAMPTVLLLCGFLLFLTYPAVINVLTLL
jgi:Flp pilus assembly protein TadB